MGAIASWVLGNPLIILAMIGVFTFTSVVSDVKAWWSERTAVTAAVRPWQKAVVERDQAAEIKEGIVNEAIEAKINAEQQVSELVAHFETAEISRKLNGAMDCNWTDDDLRVLNATGLRKTSAHPH